MSETYVMPEQPEYHEAIRRIQNSDSVDAEAVVNPLIQKMLENTHFVKLLAQALSDSKQDKLTGSQGQVVGFDKDGKPTPQAAPDTGVTSFKGRTGAVVPKAGDYTAADVGAVPTTRKVNNKALEKDISLTAADVGGLTQAAADNRYLKLSGGEILGRLTVDDKIMLQSKDSTHYGYAILSCDIDTGSIRITSAGNILNGGDSFSPNGMLTGLRQPTDDTDAANKKYVDDAITAAIAGAINASY